MASVAIPTTCVLGTRSLTFFSPGSRKSADDSRSALAIDDRRQGQYQRLEWFQKELHPSCVNTSSENADNVSSEADGQQNGNVQDTHPRDPEMGPEPHHEAANEDKYESTEGRQADTGEVRIFLYIGRRLPL